ncbi:MAG: thiamine-phosphate pyrophosphorylase [Planctomycetota bacterium]
MTNTIDRRARLSSARLLLIFTPELVEAERGKGSALRVLEACLAEVDVVQVRVKPEGQSSGPSPARPLFDWTHSVLELSKELGSAAPLITVNDRIDVALALADLGCAGCHIGRTDLPAKAARELLGPELLLGQSTRTARDVVSSDDALLDYLGFGPIYPTRTKGYVDGLGPEAAWVARESSVLPLFAIGGINETNASELVSVGRIAVGSAILSAPDPAAAAKRLRASLNVS